MDGQATSARSLQHKSAPSGPRAAMQFLHCTAVAAAYFLVIYGKCDILNIFLYIKNFKDIPGGSIIARYRRRTSEELLTASLTAARLKSPPHELSGRRGLMRQYRHCSVHRLCRVCEIFANSFLGLSPLLNLIKALLASLFL